MADAEQRETPSAGGGAAGGHAEEGKEAQEGAVDRLALLHQVTEARVRAGAAELHPRQRVRVVRREVSKR